MLANELGNLLNIAESFVAVDCRAKQISVTFSNRNIQSVNDMKNICIGNDSHKLSVPDLNGGKCGDNLFINW